ncbi:MAG TPA: hypothetical protein VL354_06895 [Spirochaetia bacterium]|nr:hypothetical protein [Spirochaetia bacterium]
MSSAGIRAMWGSLCTTSTLFPAPFGNKAVHRTAAFPERLPSASAQRLGQGRPIWQDANFKDALAVRQSPLQSAARLQP